MFRRCLGLVLLTLPAIYSSGPLTAGESSGIVVDGNASAGLGPGNAASVGVGLRFKDKLDFVLGYGQSGSRVEALGHPYYSLVRWRINGGANSAVAFFGASYYATQRLNEVVYSEKCSSRTVPNSFCGQYEEHAVRDSHISAARNASSQFIYTHIGGGGEKRIYQGQDGYFALFAEAGLSYCVYAKLDVDDLLNDENFGDPIGIQLQPGPTYWSVGSQDFVAEGDTAAFFQVGLRFVGNFF